MTGTASALERTISLAAVRLGIADPIAAADELRAVDVDSLDRWFTQAARIRVRLFQGADRLSDAVPLLAAGWSNPAPQIATGNHREAALASRQVVGSQVDSADLTCSVLRQSRSLVDGELDVAGAALGATGWPPAQDLYSWAVDNGRVDVVAGTISGLGGRLADLRMRNEEALGDLAAALRADPRESVQTLADGQLAAGQPTTMTPPGWPAAAPVPGQQVGVDQENLTRLATDLQSTELSTQLMAQGVAAAMAKAAASGDVAQLLVYESANLGSQGRAAISVGDISRADNVAVLAPGVGNSPFTMADGIGSAVAIRNAAQRQSPGDATTAIAWFGYDMPLGALHGVPTDPLTLIDNITATIDDNNAQAGGQQLIGDLDGFRQLAPQAAHFTALGFSMGSTTVSAAAGRGAKVDEVVLLASPGAGNDVDSVADYPGVPADHVFVASFDADPITATTADVAATVLGNLINPLPRLPDFSPLGPDPADADFGAQVLDVQSNSPDISVDLGGPFGALVDPVSDEVLDLMLHHREDNYLSGGALDAVGAVVTGHYSDVPIKPGR